jgi:hypothetical protein
MCAALESINKSMEFNLFVSEAGNVVLMYKAPLIHNYDYVQFDKQSNSLDFITIEGEIQNLGMNIPKRMHAKLQETRELLMVEIDENHSCQNSTLLEFIQTTVV